MYKLLLVAWSAWWYGAGAIGVITHRGHVISKEFTRAEVSFFQP